MHAPAIPTCQACRRMHAAMCHHNLVIVCLHLRAVLHAFLCYTCGRALPVIETLIRLIACRSGPVLLQTDCVDVD